MQNVRVKTEWLIAADEARPIQLMELSRFRDRSSSWVRAFLVPASFRVPLLLASPVPESEDNPFTDSEDNPFTDSEGNPFV